MDGTSAVPLFLPSNYTWNQRTNQVEVDVRKPRGSLRLCQEGLGVIRSIQSELVVVCVTGPARGGKSYFISQLQDGINFELGHTTTSKTTGVWIALSPTPIQVDGRRARLVLMDAEGLGSASTIDHGQDGKWENRVFSLCAILSSYLIYNSKGVPNSDDLDKLGFIAQFSAAIHNSSQRSGNDSPVNTTEHFRQVAPHFLWLVRDALLKPEVNGEPCDWKTYLEKEVLSVKEGEAGSRRSSVCRAITTTFQSFNAFGLPPPSVDPDVIQNLSNPRYRHQINPKFICGIQEVKDLVTASYSLKAIHGYSITGLQMAECLPSIVSAVNRECDKLRLESMWDSVVKSQLNKNFEQALELYNDKMSRVRFPAPEHYIKSAHSNALKEAYILFNQRSCHFDQDIFHEYHGKLSKSIEKRFTDLADVNNIESRKLCEKAVKELCEQYFSPVEETIEERTFADLLRAKETIFKIYSKRAKGPMSHIVRKEAEEQLQGKMNELGKIILQAATREVNQTYMDEMKATDDNLPCEEAQLDEIHRNAFRKCKDFFKAKCSGCKGFKKMEQDVESELNKLFQSYRKRNFECSREFCQELMTSLEGLSFEPMIMMVNKCKYSDLLGAKELVFDQYEVDAKGPAKNSVREKCEKTINLRLRTAQSAVVCAALSDAERKYKSRLDEILDEGPFDVEDLQKILNKDFDRVTNVFHVRCEGVEEVLYHINQESLLAMKGEETRKYIRRNSDLSRKLCEELMKKLIAKHLTPELNDVNMLVNFQKKKELIMQGYETAAKGPKTDEVREEYEPLIDEDITRGKQYRVLKGANIALQTLGRAGAGMASMEGTAGKMAAAGSAAAFAASEIIKQEQKK